MVHSCGPVLTAKRGRHGSSCGVVCRPCSMRSCASSPSRPMWQLQCKRSWHGLATTTPSTGERIAGQLTQAEAEYCTKALRDAVQVLPSVPSWADSQYLVGGLAACYQPQRLHSAGQPPCCSSLATLHALSAATHNTRSALSKLYSRSHSNVHACHLLQHTCQLLQLIRLAGSRQLGPPCRATMSPTGGTCQGYSPAWRSTPASAQMIVFSCAWWGAVAWAEWICLQAWSSALLSTRAYHSWWAFLSHKALSIASPATVSDTL